VEGLERYPINMRYPQHYRDSPEALSVLPIITPTGQHIGLGDIARIYFEDGPPGIQRENARINGWSFIDVQNTDMGSYVTQAQQMLDEKLHLPSGYSLRWAGQYEQLQRAQEKLTFVLPLTLAVIIVLLYFSFRSFTEVAIIMGTLPFALIGGVWLLYLEGFNLSVAVGVGFIALAGVAVEIGVIMLVYLNQSYHALIQQKQAAHSSPTESELIQAVLSGAALRVRPVMMTVATVMIGLLPVMYHEGTGSEVMSRIAAPLVGGMASALALSLVVVPVVYLLWKKRSLMK